MGVRQMIGNFFNKSIVDENVFSEVIRLGKANFAQAAVVKLQGKRIVSLEIENHELRRQLAEFNKAAFDSIFKVNAETRKDAR